MHKLAGALLLSLALFSVACSGGGEFKCQRDQQCANADATGICDPATSTCGDTRLSVTMELSWGEDAATVVCRFATTPSAVRVMLDGAIAGDAVAGENGWTYTIDLNSLSEGTHWVRPAAEIDGEVLYGTETPLEVARPPHVVAQTPAEGATDVPVPFTVNIDFDVPVSLPYGPPQVYDADDVSRVITTQSGLSQDKQRLTFSAVRPAQLRNRVSISYTVRDSRGDELTRSFSLSLVPPGVLLLEPYSDVTTSSTVAFRGWLSGSPEQVEVLAGDGVHIDGFVLGRMTLAENYGTFTWDTTTVAPGTYPVWLRATRGGIARTSAVVNVTVAR